MAHSLSHPGHAADALRPARVIGFTLIELMIVVAIIAILAAVAYPAYTNAVMKGKRAQGRAAALDLLQQQERYLTQNGSYMSFSAGTSGVNGTVFGIGALVNIPFKTSSGDNASSAAYTLGSEACPDGGGGTLALNECIRVFAFPGAASTDPDGNIRAMSTGVKDCVNGSVVALCWKQ